MVLLSFNIMKIIILVACLVVCGYGAKIQDEILPPGISVFRNSQNNNYKLTLAAADNAISADDQILISELTFLETRQGRSLVADLIANLLEGFRDTVINGNDDLPPLDPLVIPVIGPFAYTTTGANAQVTVNNFRAEGLRWYLVDYVNFNALRLTFGTQITIPWLTITGNYDAQARVALLLTHRASGNFRVFLNRIVVGVDMRLGTNIFGGGHLILRELDINIDVFDTNIQVTGMTGSSLINSFISSLVNSVTQDVVQSEMENVSRILSEQLFDIINDVLKDYTINDILG